jgi:DNA polymerase III epsilon subunit-like protein
MNKRIGILEVIENRNFVVLDTETTGLNAGSEIVSIAIIDPDGHTLLDTLVHPVKSIPADATRIHGITNDMVKDAQGLPVDTIHNLLDGRNVIVYNADYDMTMLYRSVRAAGLSDVDWEMLANWHCAMQTFAEIYGDWNDYHQSYRWQKLATACRYYEIPVEGAHGALADCQMTLKVCEAMLKHSREAHAD